MSQITQLLERVSAGDAAAENELFQEVDRSLRGLARRELQGGLARALRPTELVNGAYVRLFGRDPDRWPRDRRALFNAFARAMHERRLIYMI